MSKMSKFLSILKIAGPGLLMAAGVPVAVIPFVIKGMAIAEESHQSGANKKAAVMQVIKTSAGAVEAWGYYPGLIEAVDKGIDATVAAVNVFADKPSAPVPGEVPVPIPPA